MNWDTLSKIPIINEEKNVFGKHTINKNNYPYNNSTLYKENCDTLIYYSDLNSDDSIYKVDYKINLENDTYTYDALSSNFKYINDKVYIRKPWDDGQIGRYVNHPYIVNSNAENILLLFLFNPAYQDHDDVGMGRYRDEEITDIYLNNEYLFRVEIRNWHYNVTNYVTNISEKFKNNVITYGWNSNNLSYGSGTSFIHLYFDKLDNINVVPKVIRSDGIGISYKLNIRYVTCTELKEQNIPYNIILINAKE